MRHYWWKDSILMDKREWKVHLIVLHTSILPSTPWRTSTPLRRPPPDSSTSDFVSASPTDSPSTWPSRVTRLRHFRQQYLYKNSLNLVTLSLPWRRSANGGRRPSGGSIGGAERTPAPSSRIDLKLVIHGLLQDLDFVGSIRHYSCFCTPKCRTSFVIQFYATASTKPQIYHLIRINSLWWTF